MKPKSAKIDKPRVFLFHGEDDYTTTRKVSRWTEAFVKKHGGQGVVTIDCAEITEWAKELSVALESQGLFGTARLVIARNVFALKAESTEWLLKALEGLDEQTFLLFWESVPAKKALRLYKKISVLAERGSARIFEHALPVGSELNRFLVEYAISRGYKLSPAAAESLAVALGRDLVEKSFRGQGGASGIYNLWQAAGEIDKLGAYANGREIEVSDAQALVAGKTSDNIFLFTNALGARQAKTARKYLDQLFRGSGSSDVKARALPIIGALAAQFRGLLLLSAAKKSEGSAQSLAQTLGWTPYRVDANLRVLRNFSDNELIEKLSKLLEIDRKIKSTTLPPKMLLGQLV